MASDATEPAVDPALEAAASALRADLAARGIPADELPEPVMLALVVQQERISLLSALCRSLRDRLERVENAAAPLMARPLVDSRSGARSGREIDDLLGRERDDITIRSDRLRAQAEHARSLRENLTPLGTPLSTMYPPEAPRFRHDCPDCVFLGRSADGAVDLYHCPLDRPGVVVRYGDRAGHIHFACSHANGAADRREPYLAEAYRRAVARGLVGGAGEGS